MAAEGYFSQLSMEGVIIDMPHVKFVKFIKAGSFPVAGKPVSVPAHWRHGRQLKGGFYLNFNFFDFEPSDFNGESRCVDIEVVDKATDNGRLFTFVNVRRPLNGAEPVYEMEISDIQAGGVPIKGAKKFLRFNPI